MAIQSTGSDRFWHYSLSLYKQANVKHHLVDLHQYYGANLNIVLFCCWFAESEQGELQPEELIRANELIFVWHTFITKPLQILRKTLAEEATVLGCQGIPEAILKEEIWAEKQEQLTLANAIFSPVMRGCSVSDKYRMALDNINTYLDILTVPKESSRVDKTTQLCQAIFATSRSSD